MATPIHVDASQVDRTIWIANAVHAVDKSRSYEKVAIVTFINDLYRQNPGLDPGESRRLIAQAKQRFDAEVRRSPGDDRYVIGQTEYDLTKSMLTILGTLPVPGAGAAATIAKEALDWGTRGARADLDAESRMLASLQQSDSAALRAQAQEQWAALYDLARENPVAAQVVEAEMSGFLNASTTDHASAILDRNPDLAAAAGVRDIRQALGPDGALATSIEDLERRAQEQHDEVIGLLGASRAVLSDVAAKQQSLSRYVSDQQARAREEERVAAERAAHQLKFEAAGAAVYIVSTLLGAVNPAVGRAVGTVGNAALQVAQAISKYAETASKLGELTSLGAVVMTGNIVGAAMSVVSLFSGGSSPTEQVLGAIKSLGEQIDKLRAEVKDRFDRIDDALNAVLSTLDQRFRRIDYQLGVLHDDVLQIRIALYGLQGELNRFQRNLYAFLDAGFRADLKRTVNGAIDYRRTFGADMPYDPKFIDYENTLYTWAVDLAVDELRAGPEIRAYDDLHIATELDNATVESNINYLNQLAAIRFHTTLSGAPRLANPRDWTVAAQAYMRMMTDWPDHFRRVDPGRLERIRKTGEAVARACRAISTRDDGKANRAFINALLHRYQDQANALHHAIVDRRLGQHEQLYAQAVAAWRCQIQDLKMIGPANDTRGVTKPWPAPPSLTSWIPDAAKAVEQLGLGTIEIGVRWVTFWNDTNEEHKHGLWAGEGLQCSWLGRHTTASLEFVIRGRCGDVLLFDTSFTIRDRFEHHVEVVALADGSHGYYDEHFHSTWFDCSVRGLGPGKVVVDKTVPDVVDEHLQAVVDAYQGVRSYDELASEATRRNSDKLWNKTYDALLPQLNQVVAQDLSVESDLRRRARALTGTQRLITAYLVMGFSRALEADDYLRSMVHGSESLLDGDAIARLFQQGPTKFDVFEPELQRRLDALRAKMTSIFDAIDAEQLVESQRLIDATLRGIAVCEALRTAQG